jgi:VWFA-related protein
MGLRPRYMLCVLLLALPLLAQEAQKPEVVKPEEALKASVAEVIVPVTVTDDKGRFVTNLDKKDFKVFDEGKEQTVSFFTRERNQPVVVGFLIDLSNNARIHWKDKFVDAIQDLILAIVPGTDTRMSGYLIGYSTEAELLVNTTSDPEKMLERIRKAKPGGGAAMFDAVYASCTSRTLVKGEPIEPRRVIVIVGDGHDTGSKKTLDEVLELAQRNLVTIYGVSTVAFGFNVDGEKNLTKLTSLTGGRVVYPLQDLYSDVSGYLSQPSDEGNLAYKAGTGGYTSAIMRGIVKAIEATAGEITTQYILRYTPSNTDVAKKYRHIRVEVDLANVKVRARDGYYPFAP